ncbi:phosphoenolpyruvate--protein phosphotransferase [Bittarella massiliensis (ex Durand et al. 2017)]|uniref:phosphoenolpyruvate--protein phosphotransferase n=1 Tax=Bittarella massiliensis (ex Durand et al. 2017) TaxID=1720313 RepID=UPI00073ED0BA|nr:phosphoenolpyruvate--protein phosphotransferase [Bittarella massiliensis (ex Durand et al. 2017)]
MIRIKGKGVSGGVAIGRLHFYENRRQQVERRHVADAAAELARFEAAAQTAAQQLGALRDRAVGEVGESGAQIFEIHQMMLEDLDYRESIADIIQRQKVNAEYAVAATGENFSQMFSEMDDEYMRARAADVKDVSDRLLRVLAGQGDALIGGEEPVIVAAGDLTPSETVQLDKGKVLAFATAEGSSNSHTAILARTMQIPAVIGLGAGLDRRYDRVLCAVDGAAGELVVDPDEQTLAALRQKQREDEEAEALLQSLRGQENVTKDGRHIDVFANVGSVADVGLALQSDAGGVGLFRSEFLYLENSDYPTEGEQFAAYKAAGEILAGRRVIIRTLDIGADKQVGYFHLPKEENPALGYRAIRLCLDREEMFKTQLRAILCASAFGNLAIMVPMVISVEEVRRVKALLDGLKAELREQGVKFDEGIPLGIMIETPAAALIADELAQEVDFFSIGTNDLTQYTLAIDRQNAQLESLYDPHHKAILRLIRRVVESAHQAGIWVGVCGELGADLSLTETFLALGVDELSVSPGRVLAVRRQVRACDLSRREEILAAIGR